MRTVLALMIVLLTGYCAWQHTEIIAMQINMDIVISTLEIQCDINRDVLDMIGDIRR